MVAFLYESDTKEIFSITLLTIITINPTKSSWPQIL